MSILGCPSISANIYNCVVSHTNRLFFFQFCLKKYLFVVSETNTALYDNSLKVSGKGKFVFIVDFASFGGLITFQSDFSINCGLLIISFWRWSAHL